MTINERLLGLGLSKSEASIYLYLVENGISTPPQIAKNTKIAITNCYPILRALKDKKLVEETRRGKRKSYVASDPDSLLSLLEKRRLSAEELVPDLRALYTRQKNKPKIKFYDGWEQVKEIYLQSLESEELWASGSIEDIERIDPKFWIYFQKEVKRRQQFVYDLLPASAKEGAAREAIERMGIFYKPAYLPRRYESLPIDIMVWNDNVALISLEEPIIGTVITGGYFAKVFRILLEVARPEERV
ncbi:MAG TPA: helix-turn-helix domain-containing protein [Candidatus Paceibacterota bacterium]